MSNSHVEWWEDPITGGIIFRGCLTRADVQGVNLDLAERAQLSEEITGPADFLLDMEMIFRRLAEQKKKGM